MTPDATAKEGIPRFTPPPIAAALLCFADVAVLGYALHRLGFWLQGEPEPGLILASVHIGFYWRAATALWWGLLAGAAGWRWPRLGLVAGRFMPIGVAIAVAIAVLVP